MNTSLCVFGRLCPHIYDSRFSCVLYNLCAFMYVFVCMCVDAYVDVDVKHCSYGICFEDSYKL